MISVLLVPSLCFGCLHGARVGSTSLCRLRPELACVPATSNRGRSRRAMHKNEQQVHIELKTDDRKPLLVGLSKWNGPVTASTGDPQAKHKQALMLHHAHTHVMHVFMPTILLPKTPPGISRLVAAQQSDGKVNKWHSLQPGERVSLSVAGTFKIPSTPYSSPSER